MAAKIDSLSNALMGLQNMMANNSILPNRPVQGKDNSACQINNSETTIYDSAVPKSTTYVDSEITFNIARVDQDALQDRRQPEPLDEHKGDTSDEVLNVTEQFIADCAADVERRRSIDSHGSKDKEVNRRSVDQAQQLVREAEANKVHMNATPGKVDANSPNRFRIDAKSVDDNYMVVGTHIDSNLKQKIVCHEYVDFARLIPKDRIAMAEDHRMELISKDGNTYFVPVSDRECSGVITNFYRWEQAFRVFSNIYTGFFPDRATELIQYNQVICTASQSYIWENVYQYDKEFRIHMSNYPERSWAVILQQARSLCLKDRLKRVEFEGDNNKSKGIRKGETCKRFNKGKCTAGMSCCYEHRCDGCGKWGHGIHIFRHRNNNNNVWGTPASTSNGHTPAVTK